MQFESLERSRSINQYHITDKKKHIKKMKMKLFEIHELILIIIKFRTIFWNQ